MRLLLIACVSAGCLLAQRTISVQVDASQPIGDFKPSWAFFGYDEPNYTYQTNGKKLIQELVQLTNQPVHIRTHFLLATGDGQPALKWGSTNAYTDDASGKPVYDWTLVDKIFGTYVEAGAVPFVEIGFMPKALSTQPDPYKPTWVPGAKNDRYYVGWTYPPNDYQKWSDLIYKWVTHSVEKYGKAQVEKWDWEVWNEPNISYWHGTPEEYDKLYDYAVAAVKRALPSARVGGPASTGPDNPKAAEFLRHFLQHCASGKNYATGQQGAPLDFISYHVKGRPHVSGGHVQMGLSQELKDVAAGFEVIRSFPQFRSLPIVFSEADPEGCAACSARVYPQNAYRNGTLYPAYEAEAFKAMLDLEARDHMNVQGILTWAFEFEGQPYFDGLRTLATNGVDKPVLNFFRMAGLLGGERIQAYSSSAPALGSVVQSGVPGDSIVDVLATRYQRKVAVLVWNYRDEDVSGPPSRVTLTLTGIPAKNGHVQITERRIDADHSNAYTVWTQMGSPQQPTAEQQQKLKAAGQLQFVQAPSWTSSHDGSVRTELSLPQQALSLIEISW